jgi:hypothetical protein
MANTDSGDAWVARLFTGALSEEYRGDQARFLELLAGTLEAAVPAQTRVRRGGLFARKHVRALTVDLGEHRYQLEAGAAGALRATRRHVVRGIALQTADLSVPQWLEELGLAVAEFGRTHQEALDALRRRVWE